MSLEGRYLDSASQCRGLSVDLGSLGVEIESMEVNFNALRVEFKFSESTWAS